MRFHFLLDSIRPYRKKLLLVTFFVFLQAVYFTFLTFSFKFIVEALQTNKKETLVIVLWGLFIGAIVIIATCIIRDFLYSKLMEQFMHDVREKMFNHLNRLSMAYYSHTPLENTVTHFSVDLLIMESALILIPTGIGFPIFSVFTNVIALTILNWKLSLFTIAVCPLLFIGPHKIAPPLVRAYEDKRIKETELITVVQESISMQLIIKAFQLRRHIKQHFASISEQLTKKAFVSSFLNALMERWAQIIPSFLQIIALAIAVYMAYKNYIGIGTLVAFQTVFTTLIYSLIGLASSLGSVIQGLGGIKRIDNFLNENRVIIDKNEKSPALTSFHDISFKEVSFSYDDQHYILKNVSFEIAKNQFVAYVGPSGCGKSTILSLLTRFYDPTKGQVLIDGIDFREIPQDAFHSLMGYVSQEALLFNTSIKENIRLGKLDATQEEIEEAARLAEIHDTILEIPGGYDANIGERGGFLSGGQKQRIAIARAIIRKPAILVLDEITSALDPVTENAINATITEIRKDCTIVSVTHRLDSIVDADIINVLHHGEIKEHGTHEELIKQNGSYKDLWDKQHGFIIDFEHDEAKITIERLLLIPLFKDVPLTILNKVLPLFKSLTYTNDQIIIREGDPGDIFYIIVRGKIGIYKTVADQQDQVALLEDGDYFGEIALLKSVPRTALVKSLSPCLLLGLFHSDFISLLADAPQVREKLEKAILNRS